MERAGESTLLRTLRGGPVAVAVVLVAICLSTLPGVPAAAQDDDPETAAETVDETAAETVPGPDRTGIPVVTPGRCEGDVGGGIEAGVGVDCMFDLVDPLPDAPERFTLDDLALTGADGEWWDCGPADVDGRSVLLCPNVGEGDAGVAERVLGLSWGLLGWDEVATVRAGDGVGRSVFLSLYDREEVTWPGSPLEVSTWPTGDVTSAYAVVRPRNSPDVVAVVELSVGVGGDAASAVAELDFDELPPGRYRLWPCVGDAPDRCVEEVGGYPFQVIEGQLRELVEGHNRTSAERINIVFVGAGLGDGLAETATLLLGLGGPIAVDQGGQPTDDPSSVIDLRYGPMAIEPLASHRDRFNFWYLPDDLADELALVHEARLVDRLDAFGLDHVQVTALYDLALGNASDARATSFWGETVVPDLDTLAFGGARVALDPEAPLWAAETLAHEWGHGLFELRDEYYGFDGRPISHGAPNCAVDEAEALDWWGDVLDEIDPFVETVHADRTGYGLDPDPWGQSLVDAVRIVPTEGGCYGDFGAGGAWRPSQDSLMNSEIPVFGTVNRARVDEVLAKFSGRGPVSDVSDITTLACGEVRNGSRTVVECSGAVRSHLDLGEGDVRVGEGVCRVLTEAEAEATGVPLDVAAAPLRFTCSAGVSFGGWATLAVGSSRSRVPVEALAEPVPSIDLAVSSQSTQPTVPAVVAATPSTPAPAAGASAAVAIGGVLALLSAGAIVGSRRRSR